jgi:YVTN family beta-propeller protein
MGKIKIFGIFSFLLFLTITLFDSLIAVGPKIGFSLFHETIKLEESLKLNWHQTGATSKCLNRRIDGVVVNGTNFVKLAQTDIYSKSVTGSGGSATASLAVTDIQSIPTVAIMVSPEAIREGETAVLSWKSVNTVSVMIDNGIGSVGLNGTQLVGPSITTTYTITVSGNGGTNVASVTLPVERKPKCYAYIPNTFDGNVMVIDTSTNTVLTTIPVGNEPRDVAVSPDGTCVYVSQKDGIAVINMISNSLVGTIPVPGYLKNIAVLPQGNKIYVSCSRLENGNWKYLLSVIDPVSRTLIWEIPFSGSIKGVIPHPDGSRIYICNFGENKISIMDTNSHSIITSMAIDNPIDLRFNPDGTRFYAIRGYNGTSNNFVVFNTDTLSMVSQLSLSESNGVTATPFAIGLHPDGSRIYVTHSDDRFSVIDTATNKLVNTFSVVGYAPNTLCVLPDGSKIYIVCTNSNWLRVFNSSGYYGLATINLGHSPGGNGNFIGFVSTAISGKVTKDGIGVGGINVDFFGDTISKTVQTDIQGKYIFAVKKGNYTLVPEKTGLAFFPQQIRLTINGMVTNQDFLVLDTKVAPRINIAATSVKLLKGKSTTLIWTAANANSVSLDNGIGAVSLNGSIVVSPVKTTTYTVSATNSVLTASSSVIVTVTYPLPTVKLNASPTTIAPGGSSTLTWISTGADSASIDNGVGIVEVNSFKTVTPIKSTTYKITVLGLGGVSSASATVNLKYPTPTVLIMGNPDLIPPGGSSTLSWTSANAMTATISNGIGSVPVNGTRVVFPRVATTYTITVTGKGGTARSNVIVNMLDLVLKSAWNNMKASMIVQNVDGAISYFSESTKVRYKELYTAIFAQLPQVAQGMGAIDYLGYNGDIAIYRIKRKDIIDSQEQLISYRIYFALENGKWVIYKY